MITKQEADALMVKHGGNKTRVAGELGIQRATLRNILNGAGNAGVMSGVPVSVTPDKAHVTSLKGLEIGGLRMARKKPADSIKSRLYTLEQGKGYPIDEAAREWGVGVETLRKHAREVDAVMYVELTPENWIQMLVYPRRTK